MRRSSTPRPRRPRFALLRDDRGSMTMLMLVILIGMSFGALLIPMVIGQNQTTRYDDSRVHSLHAAQAGFDVALGLIRSATPDGKIGDTTKLPCGPLSGAVNDAVNGGNGYYTVSIEYYVSDPASHLTDSAADSDWRAANKMLCAKSFGPYRPATNVYTPSFALLASTGDDGAVLKGGSAGRMLRTTYVFKTTNTNISGGIIRIFPDSSGVQYCMDAGATPAVGTPVTIKACDLISKAQGWSYNADLSIQLVSSVADVTMVGNAQGNGLCLDSPGAHAANNAIVLGWCAAQVRGTDLQMHNINAPWNQQWSSDDNAHLRGAKPDKSDTDTFCINVAAQASAQALTLQACAGFVTDIKQTWVPQPTVGSGAAAAPDPVPAGYLASQHQLVNFLQFGRCLDVTGMDVTQPYMIAYSCKQNPNPAAVSWNQKWGYNGSGEWVTFKDGKSSTPYCLTRQGTSVVSGSYVNLVACPTVATDNVKWRNNLTQDGSGNELPYANKYTVTDPSGAYCLSLSPSSDLLNGQYYKTTVETCNGTPEQKWNALPNAQIPVVQNTIELPYKP